MLDDFEGGADHTENDDNNDCKFDSHLYSTVMLENVAFSVRLQDHFQLCLNLVIVSVLAESECYRADLSND